MSPFHRFRLVLEALDDGRVIRTSVARVLRGLAVLFLLGGVYLLVEILKTSFRLSTEGTIGGLVLATVFAAAVLGVVQIVFYRAREINEPERAPFVVIPICSILFRALGEIYATLGIAIAVGGCFYIWFSKLNPFALLGPMHRLFPSISPEATFLGGVLFLLNLGLLSFFGLLGFYFLAESVVVMVEIAKNTRYLAK
jgi:hypothetical protein